MKKHLYTAIAVWALCCLYFNVKAQSEPNNFATFFIDITNSAYEPSVATASNGDGVDVLFSQTAVKDIAQNYTFHQFHRAFPNSTDPNLENRFIVEVNSLQFMYDLASYNSTIFANGELADFKEFYVTITDPAYVPTYQLNNYVSTVTFAQSALNDIAADYSFTAFYPAFPNSTEPSQANVYIAKMNLEDFMTALGNYNSTAYTGITSIVYRRLLLTVTDHSYIPNWSTATNGQAKLNSGDPAVQAILNKYTIGHFRQLYPTSSLEHLRQTYLVTCNSLSLVTELTGYNNAIFPDAAEIGITVPAYTPVDYGHALPAPNDNQRYLDLIKAEQAWDITKGDPDVKMGIVDYYTNPNHPDLQGKIVTTGVFRNDPNHIFSPAFYGHGTNVAGTMVGATDNIVNGDTIGQASIGFNCRTTLYSIDTSGNDGSDNVLMLAQDGNRVINCSWIYANEWPGPPQCSPSTTNILLNDMYLTPKQEDAFNEAYEKGAVVVAGAGNNNPAFQCARHSYNFPASFPHNISVTSVGSNIARDTAMVGDASIMDEHDRVRFSNPPPSIIESNGHNHNKLVDICAPGYTIHILESDSTNPNNLYSANKAGTSLAAPLVSGTVGLMLSLPKKDCLSPYQIEYILKQSAYDSIYLLPANQAYANPKLLGAGRLDAEKALIIADSFDCNDSATRTMYVEEIKINHTCISTILGGAPIQLSVVVRNGNGNYTYRWRPISNNTTSLNDLYSATPQVLAPPTTFKDTNGQYILYYMVTVTEVGTDIPKVATGRIKVILREEGVDYAMKDAFMDFYNEPNLMDSVDDRNWNFWVSPDLWCRWQLDTPKKTQHQDPEYSSTAPTYVHIRIKNIGCTQPLNVGDEKLRVYWTKASTGEIWPNSWTTDNIQGTSGTVPAGREITTTPIDLPILYPSQDTIITIPWTPPNPANYDTGGIQIEVCLLARIIDSSLNEVNGNVFTNVRNNNNIVTRNLFVNDYSANKPSSKHSIDIVNGEGVAESFTLELLNDKEIHRHYSGDLSEYMYGVVHLNSLYDVWVDGGSQGSGYVLDDQAKTLSFDLATPLVLKNLNLEAGERHPIYVEFILRDNVDIPYDVRDQLVHLRQHYYNDEEQYQLAGNVSFSINIDRTETQNKPGKSTGVSETIQHNDALITAYPNPANSYVLFDYMLPNKVGILKLVISNITGQIIKEIDISTSNSSGQLRWDTESSPSGVYIYKLTDGVTILDIGKVVLAK